MAYHVANAPVAYDYGYTESPFGTATIGTLYGANVRLVFIPDDCGIHQDGRYLSGGYVSCPVVVKYRCNGNHDVFAPGKSLSYDDVYVGTVWRS